MPSEPEGRPRPDGETDPRPGRTPDGDRYVGERFSEPRRLHPASIVLGIDAGQLFNLGLIPLVALFASGGVAVVVVLGLVAVATIVTRFLDWQRRHYAFDGSELRVESGILGRSVRSLDVDRIQQIEVRRRLLQRLLGLATVRVETAGSASEPEVELRVVSESDAVALRSAVRTAKARSVTASGHQAAADTHRVAADPGAADDGSAEPILTVPLSHVVLASVTGARLLVLPAFVGAALQVVGDAVDQFGAWSAARLDEAGRLAGPLLGDGLQEGLAAGPDWWWIAPLVVLFTLVAVAAAAITGLLRDGNFRMRRADDDLHVSRGLLSTRESLVPLARVQLVTVRANWLRRLLGFATLEIRSAGGSAGGGGSVTIPLIAEADVDGVLREILPGVPGIPALETHPSGALRRRVVRRVTGATILAAAGAAALQLGGWMDPRAASVLASLLPLGALVGVVEYRHLAHAVTDRVVVSRRGAVSVTTRLGPLRKVQAVGARSGPFQRRLGLASLDVHVAGPAASLTILDAGRTTVAGLHADLTARAARPTR